ncbi:hypothetical protein [Enterobacter cloacae]|uniref:hypothetical protein n=1 Tax=Enterobacter cloacae TaxID=550 RepID=UPI00070A0A19|nr:hypothetical protein [Enterobacter cloacae]
MSTITKEHIANLLQFNSEGSDCQANAEQWEVHELARIALASLEAEPVAYSLIFRNMDGVLNDYVNANTTFSTIEKAQAYGRGGNYVRQNDGSLQWVSDPSLDPVVVPLFTAPPAPVSVPDAMEMDDDFDSAFEHGKAVGWNAYRAAMLQGAEPVTTAYKLPPHIFRELVNRLRDTAVKYQGCQQLREQLSRTLQEVIQPAEPQQEVTQALAKGMERYGDAMQKLADSGD